MPALFSGITPYLVSFFESLGASEAVAAGIASVLEYVAAAELLNAAANALAPSQKSGVGQGLETNYYNPEASLRIIYGTMRIGGMQTIPPLVFGGEII